MSWRGARRWCRYALIIGVCVLAMAAKGPNCSGGHGCGGLERLWMRAGGGAYASASLMAAIAMAESGGDENATNYNDDGSVDRGLWQINSTWGHWSRYGRIANARSAVHVIKVQGITAWVTYNNGLFRGFCGQ